MFRQPSPWGSPFTRHGFGASPDSAWLSGGITTPMHPAAREKTAVAESSLSVLGFWRPLPAPSPPATGRVAGRTGATSEDMLEEEAKEDSSSESTVCVSICTVVKEGDAKLRLAASLPPGVEWRPRGAACSLGADAASE